MLRTTRTIVDRGPTRRTLCAFGITVAVGLVGASAATGVDSAVVTIAANAKNGTLYLWGVIVSLALALLTLLYTDALPRYKAARDAQPNTCKRRVLGPA